jgi:hypothetical protein
MFRAALRRPHILTLFAIFTGALLRFHDLGNTPPGLHYDFAANAILANDIAFGNFREVFITAYTGKETLFFYTAALLFKFAGSSIFTLQLTAAIYGVLGVAACYFATRQLTYDDPNSKWIAAVATAIMSFAFMHLVWSRYGERATTEPFVQALAIGCLFRGLRHFRTPTPPHFDFILAGVFTGLAAYTYLAARLFPIPITITLITFAIQSIRMPSRVQPAPTRLFTIYLASALLVFAPLGLFFLQHPEAFLVRAGQLTPREGEADLLIKGITSALGLIFVSGEPYDRFNIPGRPIFGPLLGLFFLIGLALTLLNLFKHLRDTRYAIRNTSSTTRNPQNDNSRLTFVVSLFLLTYTLTFLLPTALSVHDIFPSNVRSMGLWPMLATFPALGIVASIRWLALRSTFAISRLTQSLLITGFAITLLAGTLTTYHSYFNLWAASPSLYYANDTDLVNAARWINTQDTRDASVYFSAIHYRHPTVAYLARDFGSFRWFTGGESLALPQGGPAIYVFPHSAPPPQDWIAGWTPAAAPLGPDGAPDFRAYRFDSATPPLPDFIPASANFGNLVELTGYRLPEPDIVDLRLYVLNPPDKSDYRLVADLTDLAGYPWTQAFNDSYFSEQWQIGETILMRLRFDLPIGMPPGNYQLQITAYSPSTNTNLPALTPDSYSAAFAAVGPIPIPGSGPQPLAEPIAAFDGLNVIRIESPPTTIRPGERLPFAIYWQAPSTIQDDTAFIYKLGDTTLEAGAPVYGTYPPSQWLPGEVVIDRHNPRVPRGFPPGVYNVTVNNYQIGTVIVEAIERQLSPPSPSISLTAAFADQFELLGYDLSPDAIALYWRAIKETDVDYTRFVHILDSSGSIIAQNDSYPRSGDYPTSLWVRGEYVREEVQIPTQGTTIEIGWYVAEIGERLKTESGDVVKIAP